MPNKANPGRPPSRGPAAPNKANCRVARRASQFLYEANDGHSPPYQNRAKQSQPPREAHPPGQPLLVETQYLASPPTGPETPAPTAGPSRTGPAPSLCETKPTEAAGAAGSGPVMAFGETQDIASLQEGADSAKQSQPAEDTLCETKPIWRANPQDSRSRYAKQSQPQRDVDGGCGLPCRTVRNKANLDGHAAARKAR